MLYVVVNLLYISKTIVNGCVGSSLHSHIFGGLISFTLALRDGHILYALKHTRDVSLIQHVMFNFYLTGHMPSEPLTGNESDMYMHEISRLC